jgi:uncharacterized protein (TIGR02118 family)
MIKLTILYPNEPNKRFDVDYYCNKHMPMALQMLGKACKGATVEQGVAGGVPGTAATYIVIASLMFDSIADFQTASAGCADALAADLPNYTDIQPIVQISEMKL